MKKEPIPPSELIVNSEGRIYHLDLHPDDISENIIIVGDQERVPLISKHFDKIDTIVTTVICKIYIILFGQSIICLGNSIIFYSV